MKKRKKIEYTDEPLGKVRIIENFLPPPEELILKERAVKVTLMLNESSVDFFKKLAKEHKTQYQKMIRVLLDKYTTFHKK